MINTSMTAPSHVLAFDESARLRGDTFLGIEGVRCRTVAPRWTDQGSGVSAAGRLPLTASIAQNSMKTDDFVVYNPGFRQWSPPV